MRLPNFVLRWIRDILLRKARKYLKRPAMLETLLIKLLGKSRATSIAGWITIIVGIMTAAGQLLTSLSLLLDGNPDTVPDFDQVKLGAAEIAAGYGLLRARDSRVTSEDAGASPKK